LTNTRSPLILEHAKFIQRWGRQEGDVLKTETGKGLGAPQRSPTAVGALVSICRGKTRVVPDPEVAVSHDPLVRAPCVGYRIGRAEACPTAWLPK
jgi:hypothetical protein